MKQSLRDEDFFQTTGSLLNRDNPKQLTIIWLDIAPNWGRVEDSTYFVRRLWVPALEKYTLMLDVSTICLS